MKTFNLQSLTKLNMSPLLFGILAAGIIIRTAGLTASAVWYDEAVSIFNVRLPFFTMIQATKYTNTPPIWEIMLWISVHILGENEFSLRLPSLIVGIVTLWVAYKLTVEFGLSEMQQHIAMLFISLLPFQFWLAQDGRIYATLSLLYLAAIWFTLRNRWVGLTACAGLLLYSHFTAPFFIATLYIVMLFHNGLSWKNIVRTLLSGLIITVCFIPWIPALIFSMQNQVKLLPLSYLYLLSVSHQAIFVNNRVSLMSMVGISITGIGALITCIILLLKQATAWKKFRNDSQNNPTPNWRYVQLVIIAITPLAALIFISVFSKNIIYYRALTAMLMPLIIWIVATLGNGLKYKIPQYGFTALWLVFLVAGLIGWSPTEKGSNLREAASFINKEWKSGDVIYHITGTSFLPFAYYLPDKPAYLLNETVHSFLLPGQLADIYGLRRVPLESIHYKRAWVIYARDPLLSSDAKLRAHDYINDGILTNRVSAWEFARIEIYLVDTK